MTPLLKIGQRWRTRGGFPATIEARNDGREHCADTYPWMVRAWPMGTDTSSIVVAVTAEGTLFLSKHPDLCDLVELLEDVAPPAVFTDPARESLSFPKWPLPRIADAGINETTEPGGIGDVTSSAKGSGARYNAGKTPFDLVPLHLLAASQYDRQGDLTDAQDNAIMALDYLGSFQGRREDADFDPLFTAIKVLGIEGGWVECAQVFDYGRRKYAEWNWAKGMKWSVPIACAARHLMAIIDGEEIDEESGLSHRGHAICNLVMLLIYEQTFQEGDDRPRAGLLFPTPVEPPQFERKRPEDTEGGAL